MMVHTLVTIMHRVIVLSCRQSFARGPRSRRCGKLVARLAIRGQIDKNCCSRHGVRRAPRGRAGLLSRCGDGKSHASLARNSNEESGNPAIWKSRNLEIWESRNQEILKLLQNGDSQKANPFCPKCLQGPDLYWNKHQILLAPFGTI